MSIILIDRDIDSEHILDVLNYYSAKLVDINGYYNVYYSTSSKLEYHSNYKVKIIEGEVILIKQ